VLCRRRARPDLDHLRAGSPPLPRCPLGPAAL